MTASEVCFTRRLMAAEEQVNSLEFGRDARLGRVFDRGEFTSRDLDNLYEVIKAPFRAAILANAANMRRLGLHRFYEAPPYPLFQFAMLIAFLSDEMILGKLAGCKLSLSIPEDVSDPGLVVWADADRRARRGLVQRLADHHGVETLREDVGPYLPIDDREWPLPVLTETEIERILRLVGPLVDRSPCEIPMVFWRSEAGDFWWAGPS